MRAPFNALALMALLGLAACGGGEAPPAGGDEPAAKEASAEAVPEDVKKVAELAKAIKAEPAKAGELLKAAGMDEAAFREKLYDIAADAKKSAAYSKLTE